MPIRTLPASVRLGIYLPRPATIQWQEGHHGYKDIKTYDTGLGIHVAHLPLLSPESEHVHFRINGPAWDSDKVYKMRVSMG